MEKYWKILIGFWILWGTGWFLETFYRTTVSFIICLSAFAWFIGWLIHETSWEDLRRFLRSSKLALKSDGAKAVYWILFALLVVAVFSRNPHPTLPSILLISMGGVCLVVYLLRRSIGIGSVVANFSKYMAVIGLVVIPISVGLGGKPFSYYPAPPSPPPPKGPFVNQVNVVSETIPPEPVENADVWVSLDEPKRGFVPGIRGIGGKTDSRGRVLLKSEKGLGAGRKFAYVHKPGYYTEVKRFTLHSTMPPRSQQVSVKLHRIGEISWRVENEKFRAFGENESGSFIVESSEKWSEIENDLQWSRVVENLATKYPGATVREDKIFVDVSEAKTHDFLLSIRVEEPEHYLRDPVIEVERGDNFSENVSVSYEVVENGGLRVEGNRGNLAKDTWKRVKCRGDLPWPEPLIMKITVVSEETGEIAELEVNDLLGKLDYGTRDSGAEEKDIEIVAENR